jgi:hypothetical protein
MRPLAITILLLVPMISDDTGAGDPPSQPASTQGNTDSGPTVAIGSARDVEPPAGGAAQAGVDEGWVPFPPTTPDVPAFSLQIVEVDPVAPPAGYRGVAQVSRVLSSNQQILLVEIRVHSECGAGREAAMRSSEEASVRIGDFLRAQGIGDSRVRLVPMGCTSPARSPEVTAADRAANRRIEVVVLEVGTPP